MADKTKSDQYCFPEFDDRLESDPGVSNNGTHDSDSTLEQEIKAMESQAYEEGYVQGRDQALDQQKAKIQPLSELLSESKQTLADHSRNVQSIVEKDAVQLALVLAQNIIQHEIHKYPKHTSHILRNALQMALGQDRIRIKTNPEDDHAVRGILEDEISNEVATKDIKVLSDPNIKRGGCLIETDFGIIDARIDQQLATLGRDLKASVSADSKTARESKDLNHTFDQLNQKVKAVTPIKACGHVTQVVGLVIEANGPMVQLGCTCDIYGNENEPPVTAEVLGFRDSTVLMMPLEEVRTIGPGSRVVARQEKACIEVGDQLLGRVIDGLGNPLDGGNRLTNEVEYPIYAQPINPLLRQRIRKPLDIGIRSVNGLLTVGCGQRMGIFAGSGVGKSVLMGMIARKSQADVNVIALIGERGRELNEFIEKELGEEGLKKSVVIVATSDHLPLVRVRGAFVATAIAEYFRDQGLHVNLMMDSLTRFAMSQREIGLALGEPPTTKGYTPSVFNLLPKLLERAGTFDKEGTITGLYTVLVEGDDMNEPIADAARSILDGHIVLTRELADQNHYPAIDVLRSISRVMEDIASLQHKHNAGRLKELLATYRKAEDLINIGAYVKGSNPNIDRAIGTIDAINGYLRQDIQENVNFENSLQLLDQILSMPK